MISNAVILQISELSEFFFNNSNKVKTRRQKNMQQHIFNGFKLKNTVNSIQFPIKSSLDNSHSEVKGKPNDVIPSGSVHQLCPVCIKLNYAVNVFIQKNSKFAATLRDNFNPLFL